MTITTGQYNEIKDLHDAAKSFSPTLNLFSRGTHTEQSAQPFIDNALKNSGYGNGRLFSDSSGLSGLSGLQLTDGAGNTVLYVPGNDESALDKHAESCLENDNIPDQLKALIDKAWAIYNANPEDHKITFSGHSLGGGYAKLAAAYFIAQGKNACAIAYNPGSANLNHLNDLNGLYDNDQPIDPSIFDDGGMITSLYTSNDHQSRSHEFGNNLGDSIYLPPVEGAKTFGDNPAHSLSNMDLSAQANLQEKPHEISNPLDQFRINILRATTQPYSSIGELLTGNQKCEPFGPKSSHPINDSWATAKLGLNDDILAKDLFDLAETVQFVPPRFDPLLLDLDGDGIETTTLENGVFFDMDNNGFHELTAWVGNDDGVLFRDLNSNGIVDNGSELFGDATVLSDSSIAAHGFEALEDLDSNTDGVINNLDTAWSELQVIKGNGILYSLEELGITEFDLGYVGNNSTNSNENTQTHTSSFTMNGEENLIANYLLDSDGFFSFTDTEVTIPQTVEDMPFVRGMGTVHDLHTAIVLDTSDTLKDLVDDYIAETDVALRNDVLDDLIYEWAGVSGVSPTSRTTLFDSRILESLEEFMGRDFFETTVTDTVRADTLLQSFVHFKEYIDAQLSLQTHLSHLNDLIESEWDPTTGEVTLNLNPVREYLMNIAVEADRLDELGQFARAIHGLEIADQTNYDEFEQYFLTLGQEYLWAMNSTGKTDWSGTVTAGADAFTASEVFDVVDLGDGNDSIWGGNGFDAVRGGDGNDTIRLEEGNDLLLGEGGDDYLEGGTEDNIYFGGDGSDTGQGQDGVDIFYGGSGNDSAHMGDGNDSLFGESGEDSLYGNEGDDYIEGGSDNDTIYGGIGNDTLDAGSGNDLIIGGHIGTAGFEGNDLFYGGTGNDTIYGDDSSTSNWYGDDIFYFNIGDGQDVIYDLSAEDTDTIVFGEGITLNDLQFSVNVGYPFWGSDLIIEFDLPSNTDKITIKEMLAATGYPITHFTFADGSTYHVDDVLDDFLTIEGTSGNDSVIHGGYLGNTIDALGGDDNVQTNGGDNNVNLGDGNDIYYMNDGNNTIEGGLGDDTINFYGNGTEFHLSEISDSGGEDLIGKYSFERVKINLESNDAIGVYELEHYDYGTGTILYDAVNWSGSVIENAQGGNYADTISGSSIGNKIWGDSGNDSILGLGGDDTLQGDAGNDEIYGGDGNDTIYGGVPTNNSVSGNDYLDGGDGNDYIYDLTGDDTIIGGSGNDIMQGHKGQDTYKFDDGWGTDSIQLDFYNPNTLDFTDVEANVTYTTTGDYTGNATDGANTVSWTDSQFHQIIGGSGNDTLTSTLSLNESFIGSAGDDSIIGGDGNDTFIFEGAWDDDIVSGGNGTDELDLSLVTADITAVMTNSGGHEVTGGTNTINWTTDDIENITTGSGDDDITGNALNNVITTGDGDDVIDGGAGNDDLSGGDGINTYHFTGSFGADDITNDDGTGTIDFSSQTTTVTVDLTSDGGSDEVVMGANTVNWSGDIIENVIGSQAGDSIDGSTGNNEITGGDGNDTMAANTGDDTYKFGDGFGVDEITETGTDEDTVDFSAVTSTNDLTIDLTSSGGHEASYGGNTVNWGSDLIEHAIGGAGDDTVSGNTDDNRLEGGAGEDSIVGGSGADTLVGGSDNDDLDGGAGDDVYLFEDGWGSDVITGDASDTDTLNFQAVTSNLTIDLNSDTAGGEHEATDGSNYLNFDTDIIENVTGGEGDDDITGNSGNNILDGHLGNDLLSGGDGDDTYSGFTDESGQDTINDSGSTGNDVADFTGYNTSDVTWAGLDSDSNGFYDDLKLDFGNGHSVLVQNYFDNEADSIHGADTGAGVIESFVFDDNADVEFEDVQALIDGVLVQGTSGGDTLTGTTDDQLFEGLAGNDTYTIDTNTNWGNDSIVDTAGTDELNVSGYFTSGSYIDLMGDGIGFMTQGTNSLYWQSGIIENVDLSNSTSTKDTIIGSSGDNVINAGGNNDLVYGNAGDDTIYFSWGDAQPGYGDSLYGGAGNDSFIKDSVSAIGVMIYGEEGHDTITEANGYIDGGSGHDSIIGEELIVYIVDQHVGSTLLGGSGHDTIKAANWNGASQVINSNDTINGGIGDDILYGDYDLASTSGSLENTVFQFDDEWGHDHVFAYNSSYHPSIFYQVDFGTVTTDLLVNLNTDESIGNNEATDGTFSVNWTDDMVHHAYLGSGDDSLIANENDNNLSGGAGNDTIDGAGGDDTYGFEEGFGIDTVVDSSGTDKVDLSELISGATVDLNSDETGGEHEIVVGANNVNWSDDAIEDVTTGSGNDHVTGNYKNNTIETGLGNDTIAFKNGWGDDAVSDTGGTDVLDFSLVTNSLSINLNQDDDENEISDGVNAVNWESTDVFEQVIGGSGSDEIIGNASNNILDGSAGNDRLDGDDGNDTLSGGTGSDHLVGGTGDDSIVGGTGSDTAVAGSGNDMIDTGDDDDVIAFENSWGQDTVTDSDGIDTADLRHTTGGVTVNLVAGGGDEITDGTNHTVNWTGNIIENAIGGSGDDDITGNTDDNFLWGRSGNDTIVAGEGDDVIYGGFDDDSLDGGAGNDTYLAGDYFGDDEITDSSGTDVLDLSQSANDITAYLTSTASDEVSSTGATMNWTGSVIENIITGSGDDNISGNTVANEMISGDGNDSVYGGAGNDSIYGGLGNDSLVGEADDDTYFITEDFGSDTIYDPSGVNTLDMSRLIDDIDIDLSTDTSWTDTVNTISWTAGYHIQNLRTGFGYDVLEGSSYDNLLEGYYGDDTYVLDTGFGDDTISDEYGNNTLDVSSFTTAVTISLASTSWTPGSDTLTWGTDELTNLVTGSGADVLTGNTDANIIESGSGNDDITGGEGNDTITGGDNDDTMDGGLGDDHYIFNTGFGDDDITDTSGSNTLDFNSFSTNVTIDLSTQTSFTESGNTVDWSSGSVDNITTGSGADTLTGDISANHFISSSGADSLIGGSGNDTLEGGTGNDTMDGGANDDTFIFENGFGIDTVIDASGTDVVDMSAVTTDINFSGYYATSASDTVTWNPGTTNIETFNAGSGDDTLNGGSGSDTIDGNGGDDTFIESISSGADYYDGGEGLDIVDYGLTPAVVEYFTHDDRVAMNGSWDQLDNIETVKGGTGIDAIKANSNTTAVTIDLESGTIAGSDGDVTHFEDFENLHGSAYDDYLIGDSSNNRLVGNAGLNTLQGGAGNDTITGGSSNDYYVFENGWGTDSLIDSNGTDTVDLTSVTTNITYNLLSGSLTDGSNSFSFSIGYDTFENILTGEGNDNLSGYIENNYFNGGAGNDTLYTSGGSDTLVGGTGNDSLLGHTGDDYYVFANDWGSDTLSDYSGTDWMDFSEVTEDITIDLSTGSVTEASNTVSFTASEFENVASGTGNDSISGNSLANTINTETGNDSIEGNGGTDNISAGSGNDLLIEGNTTGSDTYDGGEGLDTVDYSSSTSSNTLWLHDVSSTDITVVQGGDTDLFTDVETFMASSTDGADRVNAQYHDTGVTIDLEHNLLSSSSLGFMSVYNFDDITGSDYDDHLLGDANVNIINAGNGNDYIKAGAGNDTIYGDDGNDTFAFNDGWGADVLDDTAGIDTIDMTNVTTNITYSMAGGTLQDNNSNSFSFTVGYDIFENILGGSGHDNLSGYTEANYFEGNDGNDTLYTSGGADTLDGGVGDDTLEGGSGDDLYIGFTNRTGMDIIDDHSGTDSASFAGFDIENATWYALDGALDGDDYLDQLVIDFGYGNSVTIEHYFDNTALTAGSSGSGSGLIESLVFDNDASVTFAEVQSLVV